MPSTRPLALRNAGLKFVVAPILTSGGESLRRIGPRHTVALFPFVEGHAGQWGPYEPGDREAVVSMLAELHRTTPAAGSVRNAGLELAGRRRLEAALQEVNETWSGGPLSEPPGRRSRATPRISSSSCRWRIVWPPGSGGGEGRGWSRTASRMQGT